MGSKDHSPGDKRKILDDQLSLLKVNPELYPRIYQPTILQYQCIGTLHLRSSPKIDKNQTSYQCIGIEKKIKTVNHLPPTTYSNSINNFKKLFMNSGSKLPRKDYGRILGNETGFGGMQNKDNNQSTRYNMHSKHNILIMDKKFPELKKLFSGEKVESGEFNYIKHYGKTNINVLSMREIVTMNKIGKKITQDDYRVEDQIIAVAPNFRNGITVRRTDIDNTEWYRKKNSKKSNIKLLHELTTIQIESIELTIGRTRHISPGTSSDRRVDVKKVFKDNNYVQLAQISLKKGFDQVRFTADFLQGTVQDDFFNRLVIGGKKVVKNFEETFYNVKKFIDWVTKS